MLKMCTALNHVAERSTKTGQNKRGFLVLALTCYIGVFNKKIGSIFRRR